jgi:hypothetical protein
MGNYADINEKDITNSTVIGNNALGTASNQVRIVTVMLPALVVMQTGQKFQMPG